MGLGQPRQSCALNERGLRPSEHSLFLRGLLFIPELTTRKAPLLDFRYESLESPRDARYPWGTRDTFDRGSCRHKSVCMDSDAPESKGRFKWTTTGLHISNID